VQQLLVTWRRQPAETVAWKRRTKRWALARLTISPREREREGRLTRRDKLPAYTRVICDAARRFIRPINVAAVCHITHRAECCLILCVSKMDERLNFETDVRDKFQGGIWRVCLKSNVRVRYFFALSRWQLCCSPKLICRVWYKRTSATRITFSHFFLILLRNSRSLSPMHVGEPKGSESYLPLAHSFVISLVIKWANACTVIWFVVN